MEEEKNKPLSQILKIHNLEKSLPDDNADDESLKAFTDLIIKDYLTREYYMNVINESSNRRVNLAMVLIQLFSRNNIKLLYTFLGIAFTLVVIQTKNAEYDFYAPLILAIGVLMTILMIAFVGALFKNFVTAIIDIGRLKRGFCTMGYQIINEKDNNETPDELQSPSIVAYKDYTSMIRTVTVPNREKEHFLIPPVLMFFLDKNDPYKITCLDVMPHGIQYLEDARTFIQNWKDAAYALFPGAMLVLYAISMYLSCVALITLNQ